MSRKFYPIPDFSKMEALPRSRLSGGVDWYDARCGKEWANYRAGHEITWTHKCIRRDIHIDVHNKDKGAVALLWETRQRQLAELDKTLSAEPLAMPVARQAMG